MVRKNPYGQRADPDQQCYTLLKCKNQTSSRRIAGLQNGCKRGVIPRKANADRGNPYSGSAFNDEGNGLPRHLTALARTGGSEDSSLVSFRAKRGNPYFGSALDGSAEGRIAASLTLLAMTIRTGVVVYRKIP